MPIVVKRVVGCVFIHLTSNADIFSWIDDNVDTVETWTKEDYYARMGETRGKIARDYYRRGYLDVEYGDIELEIRRAERDDGFFHVPIAGFFEFIEREIRGDPEIKPFVDKLIRWISLRD